MFKPHSQSPPELFIAFSELVRPATTPFYAKLDQTLTSFDFATQARSLCAPAYSVNGRGRPGIDPVVYFKMLMVGFFEDIASERGIAERCSDSISIRAFLGYDLTQPTPDHSTLSIIRQRLGEEIYDEVFLVILSALDKHGLLKGKNVGIDTSVIQANAALKSLINRNTEEAYWEYVRRLASENGIDPKNADAVRQFDRKRPKKMSNEEWVNPHDPDAKIGPTKAGATDMIYKPEHTVDLDTGAILQAEVRLGHEADQKDLSQHVLQAQANINQAQDSAADSLTAEQMQRLDGLGFCWDAREANWEQRFAELVAIKQQRGHCDVPRDWPENPELAGWVLRQRYREHTLGPERIKKLEGLGFRWPATDGVA